MSALTAKALLERNILFRNLAETTIDRIAGLATTRSYPKGKLIFSQGDPGDASLGLVEDLRLAHGAITGRWGAESTMVASARGVQRR